MNNARLKLNRMPPWLAAAALLCQLAWSGAASAHVTPPAPRTVLAAAWPIGSEQEHDAIVPLVLVVDANGAVSDAQVEASLAPELDAAALHAAREFQFEPATDDGVAVAAKIRVVVRFVGQAGKHYTDERRADGGRSSTTDRPPAR
jgi:TonB family protein